MSRPLSAQTIRERKLRLLRELLSEFGEEVIRKGHSLRIAGGCLKLQVRKPKRLLHPKTKQPLETSGTLRLVWRGPVLGVVSQPHSEQPF